MTNSEFIDALVHVVDALRNPEKVVGDPEMCADSIIDEGEYVTLHADYGYAPDVGVLAEAKDTGNGHVFCIPTYSSTGQDNYFVMDYAEADYIFRVLRYIISKKEHTGDEE